MSLKHENFCKDHDYCYVEMPDKDNNILKYNAGEKCMKVPFVICAELECLLENISTCYNDSEKSSTTKINKHTPLVIHCLYTVNLIQQKIVSLIVIEVKVV